VKLSTGGRNQDVARPVDGLTGQACSDIAWAGVTSLQNVIVAAQDELSDFSIFKGEMYLVIGFPIGYSRTGLI
jgi:hypothetical protein